MTNPLETIKPRVRALKAYTLSPDRASAKLNQNENPWDAPEAIKRETLRRMEGRAWSRYPDFVPASLHERLAGFAGWTPEGIVAGVRAVESERPSVTIICSPNNPTGCVLSEPDLARLLEASPGLVVVDEAYHEFSGQTAAPLLKRYPNLVVFRTFSKALALAALRVGYLLAAPELAREIGKAVLPYNLNAFSQTAAEVAVEQHVELERLVSKIVEERGRLYEGLRRIDGLAPVASRANFMVVRSRLEPRGVFRELLARDILVRDVSGYPMLKDYFRVSVGTPEENDRLLAALGEIFGGEVLA
jgi:histidinol-phosphate aminotransferase